MEEWNEAEQHSGSGIEIQHFYRCYKEADTEPFNNSISKHNKLHYSKLGAKMKGSSHWGVAWVWLTLSLWIIVDAWAENGSGKFLTILHNKNLD